MLNENYYYFVHWAEYFLKDKYFSGQVLLFRALINSEVTYVEVKVVKREGERKKSWS